MFRSRLSYYYKIFTYQCANKNKKEEFIQKMGRDHFPNPYELCFPLCHYALANGKK
jgi:hypothetical protein